MAENSKIEWTDHTFNPWIGCTKVSPGCAHCYAERDFDHRKGRVKWGAGNARERTSADNWKLPLRWNRAVQKEIAERVRLQAEENAPFFPVARPRVFCASLADWLDDEVPIEWLADLLDLVRQTPHLDWLLLSKRPQNWYRRIHAALAHVEKLDPNNGDGWEGMPETQLGEWLNEWTRTDGVGTPANVWIGTTVEDQQRADERIPEVLKIPARVRFLSCEPLLGRIELNHPSAIPGPVPVREGIDWVICGGESGPLARAMHPDWARSLREQCDAAGVAFFFKQWGEWLPQHQEMDRTTNAPAAAFHIFKDGLRTFRVGKIRAGRLLDGVEHSEFPACETTNTAT